MSDDITPARVREMTHEMSEHTMDSADDSDRPSDYLVVAAGVDRALLLFDDDGGLEWFAPGCLDCVVRFPFSRGRTDEMGRSACPPLRLGEPGRSRKVCFAWYFTPCVPRPCRLKYMRCTVDDSCVFPRPASILAYSNSFMRSFQPIEPISVLLVVE